MDGLLIINKEKNFTSRDVVNIISKKLNTKKIGHTGTLDPLAEGVLVLAVNQGTKIIDLLTNMDKEYIATGILDYDSDTLDICGEVVKNKPSQITTSLLNKTMQSFLGTYVQEVPKYSAVKVNGKRLYEYARQNINVKLPTRDVTIKEIELLSFKDNAFKFRVVVSKGTYIRSLIRDIGKTLNTTAIMSELIRTRQGLYEIKKALKISEVTEKDIIPLTEALLNYPQIIVTPELEFKIKNGVKLPDSYHNDICVFLNQDNKLLAIYKKESDYLKPIKVFN